MKKRLRKSEKLNLILSELSKLKTEIKKLLKHRAVVAGQGVKAKSRSTGARRPKNVPSGAAPGRSRQETRYHQGQLRPRRSRNQLAESHLNSSPPR
jgi:hypothetical protein